MRFSIAAAVFGLAAFAVAQNSTTAAPMTSVAPTPEQRCIAACGTNDICCKARCVNVPCPTDLQANSTTTCAAQCSQGNGSQADTEAYARCQQACISSSFFPLSGTAAPTGGSGSGPATSTKSGATGAGTGAAGSPTRSGAGAATTTPNAGPRVQVGVAGAGLLGLVVAGLAL